MIHWRMIMDFFKVKKSPQTILIILQIVAVFTLASCISKKPGITNRKGDEALDLAGIPDSNTTTNEISCGPYSDQGNDLPNHIQIGPHNGHDIISIINNAKSDTLITIEDGTYVAEGNIILDKQNVIIRSQSGDREQVIIDGNFRGYIFQLMAPDITIADITIKEAHNHLMHVSGPAKNARLHNLNLVDSREQFIKVNRVGKLYPDNGVIDCSHFYMTDSGRSKVAIIENLELKCYTGGIDALSVKDWKINDNYFENIYCTNGDLPTHMVLFWSGSQNPIVERNLIVNCARGIGFGLGNKQGFRKYSDNLSTEISGTIQHYGGIIRNNVIFSTIGGYADTGISVEQGVDVSVLHNTVLLLEAKGTNAYSSIDIRYNNSNTVVKNNLYYPSMTTRDLASPVKSGNMIAEMGYFVNPNGGDLHLKKEAREFLCGGNSVDSVVYDFDGDRRQCFTVGADE